MASSTRSQGPGVQGEQRVAAPPSSRATTGTSWNFPTAAGQTPRDPSALGSAGATSNVGLGRHQRGPAAQRAPPRPQGSSPAFPGGRCTGILAEKRDHREACGHNEGSRFPGKRVTQGTGRVGQGVGGFLCPFLSARMKIFCPCTGSSCQRSKQRGTRDAH